MLTALLSRCLVSIFGTLYPAYRSYKAIKHRDLQEYTKCLRYWVVYACFVVLETVTDMLICWIPFYYEFKILLVICLLIPPGSTVVYKNLVQPTLRVHEADIDRFLERTRTGGYNAVMSVGSSLLKYSSDMFINSALKGSSLLSSRLVRSVSSNNVCCTPHHVAEELDERRPISRRGQRQCYSGQYASTIGTSGAHIWRDAGDLLSHFGKGLMGSMDSGGGGGADIVHGRNGGAGGDYYSKAYQKRVAAQKRQPIEMIEAELDTEELEDEDDEDYVEEEVSKRVHRLRRARSRHSIHPSRIQYGQSGSHMDIRGVSGGQDYGLDSNDLAASGSAAATRATLRPKTRGRSAGLTRKSMQAAAAASGGAMTRSRYREMMEREDSEGHDDAGGEGDDTVVVDEPPATATNLS